VAEPGSGSVKLTWEAVTGATGYKITKSTTSGGTFENADTTSGNATTSCTISSLTPGTRYYFKVQGVSGATEGTQSAEVTAIANVDDNGNVFVGNKLLVSNESTDIVSPQSTGTLNGLEDLTNMNTLDSEDQDSEALRIDPVIPFQPEHDQEITDSNESSNMLVSAAVDDTKDLITRNFSTGTDVIIAARCAYSGTKVDVWVDNRATPEVLITNELALQIGQEFETKIYNKIRDNFGLESDVNNDGKVAIFCFDIQDGYSGSGAFYGGYFSPNDVGNSSYNNMDIIYIDTYPTMGSDKNNPIVSGAYPTLAHEFQHLVNFNQTYNVEHDTVVMDNWLNEALSLAAEDMIYGSQTDRITYVNNNTAIRDGRSLIDWNTANSDIVANYSLSYLFSQYLRTQIDQAAGDGEGVLSYKSIIEDPAENYVAVENVIKDKIDTNLTFGQFMTNFRAAMLLKADSGPYGFNNEAGFDTIITPTYTGTGTTLKGGGAVVKSISLPFTDPENGGANITYLGIYN
jgi:hypothetical protein